MISAIPQPSGIFLWLLAAGGAPRYGNSGSDTMSCVAMDWERPLTQLLVPSPRALAFTAVDSFQTCFLSPSPRVWVSQAAGRCRLLRGVGSAALCPPFLYRFIFLKNSSVFALTGPTRRC